MSARPLRVAVVGVGHLGKVHARIFAELEDAELVCVADKNGEQAQAIAADVRDDLTTGGQKGGASGEITPQR